MRVKEHPQALTLIACVAALLCGCTSTIHVEVPTNFHGHARIECGVIAEDSVNLKLDATGRMDNALCPAHQGRLQVSRSDGTPLASNERWVTTGDGLVREISFDVP